MKEKTAEALFEVGRVILNAFFEHLYQELMKGRERGLHHLGTRKKDILTRFGVIRA